MKKSPFLACVLLALTAGTPPVHGQTPQELRRAFQDMRADNIPHNCERAIARLYPTRARLKDTLLEELYKTDRQGRDAILHLLFNVDSLVPDERLIRLVLARLAEEDTYVHRNDVDLTRFQENERGRLGFPGAHWEAWKFIDEHFDAFDPLLSEEIGRTNRMWELWGAVWLLKKRGALESHANLFTPEVMARAAANLRDDNKSFNASQAVRFFILLGDRSLPTLREATRSTDPQAANLARATLDALKGERRAFGFLNSKLHDLGLTLWGEGRGEPEWLGDATDPYLERDRYP